MENLRCFPHCIFAKPPRTALPPPPIRLSTTNDVPPDFEIRVMRERIHAGRARLVEIDAEIARLESLLGPLRRERQDVQDNIDQHLAVVSPIRSLPSDILDEIFSWSVPVRLPESDFVGGPWILTHVCARWRNVAISLPALWSTIHLLDVRIPLNILTTQLERSRPCPLTIDLFANHFAGFTSILEHSERWHTLDLSIFDWMVPLLNETAGRLPLLRSLTYDKNTSLSDLSLCRAFEAAPCLREGMAYTTASIPLPYNCLTRFRYKTSTSLAAAPLKSCHNLLELTLVCPDTPEGNEIIELPLLQRLRIGDGFLLDRLLLPALEELALEASPGSLVPFIHRSACSLRKLINECTASPTENILLLAHIPTLVELHTISTPDDMLRLMAPPPSESHAIICPRLRAMHLLLSCSVADCTKITQLMQSRHNNPSCPALSLSLHDLCYREFQPHFLATQALLQQRGMDVGWLEGAFSWESHLYSLLCSYP
ncbi:hypothetical protein C8J57DRAFT_1708825 [Mycena rebaudengoi]|nr:hypothetical protein C8J57DRAFT_1708825 [Mycena rebaudengoi]